MERDCRRLVLDDDLKQRLARLKATKCTQSSPAAEDAPGSVDRKGWEIGETREAVAEADREEFANETQVRSVLRKWGVVGL